MLLWDGSRHAWLEGRGPQLCLVGAIDDATGDLLPGAHFVAQECAAAYLRVLHTSARSRTVGHYFCWLRNVPQETRTGMQLIGPDVILVHRLLKNPVAEATGVSAYALVTDALLEGALPKDGGRGGGATITSIST